MEVQIAICPQLATRLVGGIGWHANDDLGGIRSGRARAGAICRYGTCASTGSRLGSAARLLASAPARLFTGWRIEAAASSSGTRVAKAAPIRAMPAATRKAARKALRSG